MGSSQHLGGRPDISSRQGAADHRGTDLPAVPAEDRNRFHGETVQLAEALERMDISVGVPPEAESHADDHEVGVQPFHEVPDDELRRAEVAEVIIELENGDGVHPCLLEQLESSHQCRERRGCTPRGEECRRMGSEGQRHLPQSRTACPEPIEHAVVSQVDAVEHADRHRRSGGRYVPCGRGSGEDDQAVTTSARAEGPSTR